MQRRKPSKRSKAAAPIIAEPSQVFRDVDAMTRQGEAFGWPGREAFAIAMLLYIEGVRPGEAEQLFVRAGERVQ